MMEDEDLSPEDIAAIGKMKAATTQDGHGNYSADYQGATVVGSEEDGEGGTVLRIQKADGTTCSALVIETEAVDRVREQPPMPRGL